MSLGPWLRGSLGKYFWRVWEPRKAGSTFRSNFKGAGADHPQVMEDELMGKEARLAEQRPLAGTEEQKESL